MSEQDSGQQRSDRRDDAEEMARLQEQINKMPVSEHILYMMHSLSALAIDRLGLSAEGAARKDVQQSRMAIDAFRALLGVLEEVRPTEEIAAHRGVLSQLQMAFVGALGSATPPEEGGDGPSGEAQEAEAEEASEAEEPPKAEEAPKPSKASSSAAGSRKKSGSAGAAKTAKKSGTASTAKTAKKSPAASKRKGEKKES